MKRLEYTNIYNCILGGAIGDALGLPVRDLSYDIIVSLYGKKGVTDIEVDCDSRARVTANTQLNIFTIDAMMRAFTKYYIYDEIGMGRKITYANYLRWQYYQGRNIINSIDENVLKDNYLYFVQELKYERSAEQRLKDILEVGVLQDDNENDDNFNCGSSCLTKSVAYGIVFSEDDTLAFDMAVQIAKLTHGDVKAYLSCGIFAVIIANIVRGESLEKAIENGIEYIKDMEGSAEVIEKIELAFELSQKNDRYPEQFDDFGLCDDAHEVLGAAIYVCLVYQKSISKALLFSVNNSCYGNNIATIVGQVLGLYVGLDDKCIQWSNFLEMKDLLKTISSDLMYVIKGELPKQIDNYDNLENVDDMKAVNDKDIANWWLVKYDKI